MPVPTTSTESENPGKRNNEEAQEAEPVKNSTTRECVDQSELHLQAESDEKPVRKKSGEMERMKEQSEESDLTDWEVVKTRRKAPSIVKEKRKKGFQRERTEDGPARKKSRTSRIVTDEEAEEADAEEAPRPKKSIKKGECEKQEEDRGRKRNTEVRKSNSKPHKENTKRGGEEVKSRRRISTSSSSHSHVRARSVSKCDCDPTPPALASSSTEPEGVRGELLGMLIESMATSRASSLPVSSLCRSVLQCRPALVAQRSEKEWLPVFESVLEEGRKSCGVFGKVESSGKVRICFAFRDILI